MFKKALLVAMFCLVPFSLQAEGIPLVQQMKPVACGEFGLIDKDLKERFLENPTTIGFVGVNANNLQDSKFNVLIIHYQNKFTFTYVEQHVTGTACVISAGTNLEFDMEKYKEWSKKLQQSREGSKL